MLSSFKTKYWEYQKSRKMLTKLDLVDNAAFSEYIKVERNAVQARIDNNLNENNQLRIDAAISWLLSAQKASPDKGVSLGYFPLSEHNGWMPSYPETTGYIITTLLNYAKLCESPTIAKSALQMADWEIEVQMANGAVQGGPVCEVESQKAAAFNTGMVVDGWVSAYEFTHNKKYLNAAIKAATFLANDLDENGFFKTNGTFVSQGEVKTYTCLCAWAMYRAGRAAKQQWITDAAIRSVEAALGQRNHVGWFANNCLTHSDKPLTHTIGYVLQGILEVGLLAQRDDFIKAAKSSLLGALSAMHANGYLSARLDKNWQPKSDYVCLTGSAQLAILCFRIYQYDGDEALSHKGNRLLNFVKATQLLDANNNAMVGAIAGSFPLLGNYMKAGYPNWATKYFIDGLLLQDECNR